MRRTLTIVLVAIFGLGSGLFVAACGDKTKVVTDTGSNGQTTVKTVADVHFAKTKFVLHMGLAYGAFHRYIQKPYQAGSFKSGADKQKRTIVKAGIAAAFIYHELKLAHRSVESDDTLRTKLLAPMDKVIAQLGGVVDKLKAGKLPTDLGSLVTGMGGLKGLADGAGAAFKDKNVSIPGL